MGYNAYINYLNSIGLERTRDYNYLDKAQNIMRETERMINRSLMMFEWHGLPDTIPQRQLELILQMQGYAVIGKINGNLYACYAGLGGLLDEYLRPTIATVSIPYLDYNAQWEIGTDCIVIRNDTLQQGLLPLYSKYVTLINETEISLLLATVNQRIETIISASDNPTIESARQYLKDLFDGKQGVIADNAFLQSLSISNNRQVQGQIRELLESLQYLKASLFNEIGLATNYNLKKERVSKAEIELNTDNLYPLVDDMYYSRNNGIDDCKALFGIDWQVELNSSWDYRVYNGEPITTKGDSPTDVNAIDTQSTQDGLPIESTTENETPLEAQIDPIQEKQDESTDKEDNDGVATSDNETAQESGDTESQSDNKEEAGQDVEDKQDENDE